jgi:hypothetical protein
MSPRTTSVTTLRDTGRGGNTQLSLSREAGSPKLGGEHTLRDPSSYMSSMGQVYLDTFHADRGTMPVQLLATLLTSTDYHGGSRPIKLRGFPSRPIGRIGAPPHHLPSSNPLDPQNQSDRTPCQTPHSARTTSSNGLRETDGGYRGSESGRCAKRCGRVVCRCVSRCLGTREQSHDLQTRISASLSSCHLLQTSTETCHSW